MELKGLERVNKLNGFDDVWTYYYKSVPDYYLLLLKIET